jgi:hypothetical protein
MAPLRRYNPSAELLDWASESYSINALDERVLGEFIEAVRRMRAMRANGAGND